MHHWVKQTIVLFLMFFSMQLVAAEETIGQRYRIGSADDQQSIYGKVTRVFTNEDADSSVSQNLSRTYLSGMFGHVKGTLQGEKYNLVALLFRVFNLGIISIATLLIIYASVFSVSTTSQDGGAIGSGRFSPWILTRVVVSWASLVPTFGGYSLVQVIVMKIVIAGTVVADIAWEAAVDLTASTSPTAEVESPAEVALALLPEGSDFIHAGRQDQSFYSVESIEEFLNPINIAIINSIQLIKKCSTIMEGGYVGGDVTPTFFVRQSADTVKNTETMAVSLYLNAGKEAVEIPCFSLLWMGEKTIVPTADKLRLQMALREYIKGVSQHLLALHMDPTTIDILRHPKAINIFVGHLHNFSVRVKNNGMDDFILQEEDEEDEDNGYYKKQGWVSAGLNYTNIQRVDNQQKVDNYIDFGKETVFLVNNEYRFLNKELKPRALKGDDYLEEKSTDNSAGGTRERIKDVYAKRYIPKKTGGSKKLIDFLNGIYLDTGPGKISLLNGIKGFGLKGVSNVTRKFHMGPIMIDPGKVIKSIQALSEGVVEETLTTMLDLSKESYKGSPIEDLSSLGKSILKHTATYFGSSTRALYVEITRAQQAAYGVFSTITFVKGILKGLVAYYQAKGEMDKELTKRQLRISGLSEVALVALGDMIADPVEYVIEFAQSVAKAVVGVYLPLGNGLAVVYFLAGITLASYVPFLPTLIYIFSVMAWMFAVIEAMIAAPIVMIGFAHPEGHEMLGKAEQAVMLLTGVFVRPVITVIGFLIAVLLSSEIIKLFSFLFSVSLVFFVKNVMSINHPISLTFSAAGIVILYAYALVIILQQCYSMIYVIPDQILKWVGGPAESAGAGIASAMRSVSTGLTQQAQSAAMGAGQASGGATRITTKQT